MPKLMKRRNIRKDELIEICIRQVILFEPKDTIAQLKHHIAWLGYCECGCKGTGIDKGMFLGKVEYDHLIPNAQLYEGDEIKWRALKPSCHAKKTKLDNARTAKAKRQAGETGQYARRKKNGPKMKGGRGFQSPPGGHKMRSGSGFNKPPGHKTKWPSRKLKGRNTFNQD